MGVTTGAQVPRDREINQAGERRSSRIESLRALAALSVLTAHMATVVFTRARVSAEDFDIVHKLLFGGVFGVPLFFALTGYLLFWPFAKRDFGGGDAINLRRYATNRALRILPLYYVVVVFTLSVVHDVGPGTWLRFLTLTENFEPHSLVQVLLPAWSLVVEVHFYLLLPLLAYGIARLARGSRAVAAAVLLTLAAISLLGRVTLFYEPAHPDLLWRYNIPTTFMFFSRGCCWRWFG